MAQLIGDPEFDDPAQWELNGFGVSVDSGQLKFVLSASPRVAPIPDVLAEVGAEYSYRLDIVRATSGFSARALFGGKEIWTKPQGVGIFTGTIVATASTGLVFQSFGDTYSVERVYINEMSIAKSALDAIIARLQDILIANGYNTDAGNQVSAGCRFFNDDATFPILTVFSGDEVVEKLTYNSYRSERAVNIEAYVKDASSPTDSIEDIIEDIQNAVELADISLGGLVEVLDYTGIEEIEMPESGSDLAGVRVTYTFTYQREYGA